MHSLNPGPSQHLGAWDSESLRTGTAATWSVMKDERLGTIGGTFAHSSTTQRPELMDKTKTFDNGRSLSRLARARRNASGRAVTLTLARIRTKREREGTREDHIDHGDGRETRHWASCVSSPSGSCAAKQGLVEKRVTVITRIPHCPPLGPRTRT